MSLRASDESKIRAHVRKRLADLRAGRLRARSVGGPDRAERSEQKTPYLVAQQKVPAR
jgi:hypothetical protein